MQTTRLSSKGQVIIPKPIRATHRWESGLELEVVNMGDGVLLRPKTPFTETRIDEVAACLAFEGKTKSLDEMDAAIQKGVNSRFRDRG